MNESTPADHAYDLSSYRDIVQHLQNRLDSQSEAIQSYRRRLENQTTIIRMQSLELARLKDEAPAPGIPDDGPREPGTRPDTATAGQLYTAQIRLPNGEFARERRYIVMCNEDETTGRKRWQVCSPSNRKLYTVPGDGVLINALIDPWVALSSMSKPPYAPEDNEEDS